jgi:hypothetical protein
MYFQFFINGLHRAEIDFKPAAFSSHSMLRMGWLLQTLSLQKGTSIQSIHQFRQGKTPVLKGVT